MKTLFAVTIASVYGLSLRLLFGFFDDLMGIMSMTFLILVPMLIGFLTIILIPEKSTPSGIEAFFKPWLTSLAILFITIMTNIEGTICWIMIFPLFAILAGFGGVMAYRYRAWKARKNSDDFKSPTTLNVSLFFLVPAVIGLAEGDRSMIPREFVITEEVVVTAAPEAVWNSLIHINEVSAGEKQASFSSFLGFPKHLRTTLDTAAIGGKRVATYEKGLFFEETISQYEANRLMVLKMKIDPNKIPATVMDEHIVIGGKHLDILEDTYQLEALPDGTSKLTLSSRFYINTPFNWYASLWAKNLMADILEEELDLIKERTTVSKEVAKN